MPFLICPQCDHYYEVEPGEEFSHCECGQALIQVENLEEYYSPQQRDAPQRESMATGNTFTEEMAYQYHDNKEKGKNLTIIGGVIAIMGLIAVPISPEFPIFNICSHRSGLTGICSVIYFPE